MRNQRANTHNEIIRDNSVYPVVIRRDGFTVKGDAGYYRRRTSFAGTFTGSYDELVAAREECRSKL